jgi:hypothetical protein
MRWFWVVLVALSLVPACGGSETDSTLSTRETEDGTLFESKWTYRSFEVDIDLSLGTRWNDAGCATSARLSVNDVVSARERYNLAPTECSVLRLTESGDIVLYELETGHNWANEELSVDTSDEVITLGPVTLADASSGEPVRYAFTLSAPPCPDDDDCNCGALVRHANGERSELPLGRKCD